MICGGYFVFIGITLAMLLKTSTSRKLFPNIFIFLGHGIFPALLDAQDKEGDSGNHQAYIDRHSDIACLSLVVSESCAILP